MKNVLITSINDKIPLIKALRKSMRMFDTNMRLIGADTNKNVLGSFFVDEFWQIEKRDELQLERFINQCKDKNILYIFPTSDGDVMWFSEHKELFMKNGINIFCSNSNAVKICNDKLAFYEKNSSLSAIPTFTNIDEIKADIVVIKERFGAGFKKGFLNLSKNEALKLSCELQSPIFQPFIKGEEFSIDTYVCKNLDMHSIVRKRDIVKNGEAKVTTYVEDKALMRLSHEILKNINLTGHVVTQIIKENEKLHVVECNARFGGASTLSFKMGLHSFYWFFCECHEREFSFKKDTTFTRQIRVQEDIYV